jgi:hypothetical protein
VWRVAAGSHSAEAATRLIVFVRVHHDPVQVENVVSL